MSTIFYTFAGPGARYQARTAALRNSPLGQAISLDYPWIFIHAGGSTLSFDGQDLHIPHPEGYGNLGFKMLYMVQNFLHSDHRRLVRIDDDVDCDPKRLKELIAALDGWDYSGIDYSTFKINDTEGGIQHYVKRMPELSQAEVRRRMSIYHLPGRNPVSYAVGAFMTLSRRCASRVYSKLLDYHSDIIVDDMMLGQAFIDTDKEGLKIGRHPLVQKLVKREIR